MSKIGNLSNDELRILSSQLSQIVYRAPLAGKPPCNPFAVGIFRRKLLAKPYHFASPCAFCRPAHAPFSRLAKTAGPPTAKLFSTP
ncbi:hypothetical protein NPIL_426901 [Nephila pilipes]|uniref:Uncharacterized protein n=1 Tax=Nephila pilipes TaxID=299642 RepID=A0A8X6UQC8_NEPPI|nr:hypothetical protein NPIL_426901 [Nephila pilipes]